jgi:hypothetical protein
MRLAFNLVIILLCNVVEMIHGVNLTALWHFMVAMK